MQMIRRSAMAAILFTLASVALAMRADAQAVVAAWGNVEGIRLDGDVVPFETSVCLVDRAGAVTTRTAKERQQPRYSRSGTRRSVTTRLGSFSIAEVVEDVGRGSASLDIRVTADSATASRVYLCVDAPLSQYGPASVAGAGRADARVAGMEVHSSTGAQFAERGGRVMTLRGSDPARRRRVVVTTGEPTRMLAGSDRRQGSDIQRVLIPIVPDSSSAGRTAQIVVRLEASAVADHSPITLEMDATREGREFDGLGGNFRIQNPALDPKVIAYNLANLRVAWARVEMPWRTWQPDSATDPSAQDTTQLDPRVRAAMEMARTMARRGAPVVVSAWFPPQWAVLGQLPRNGALVNGVRGNALDPAKMERIYASITSYLVYLKQHYGVEAALFSFNESDLGIDVRQTAQEHDDLIKGLGAYMKSKGLATKMLLGDASDATPTWFIAPTMRDSAAWPYVGAVSYHSWRGWSDSLLTFWLDAAKRIDVPLLVGEGSTDAGAYRYPLIFQEPDMALYEIELYVRMLAISQPKSILQWQLTSDYSLLTGGGIFGDTSAMRPTQRFWNLKQLASTPEHVRHLPIRCAGSVSCAAMGNRDAGRYAVHVVNTGASRPATLAGIPRGITSLRVWTTSATHTMTEGAPVRVRGGRARFSLEAASYVMVGGEGR